MLTLLVALSAPTRADAFLLNFLGGLLSGFFSFLTSSTRNCWIRFQPEVADCGTSDVDLTVDFTQSFGALECGEAKTVGETQDAPTVTLSTADAGKLYTILMVDTGTSPCVIFYLHLFVILFSRSSSHLTPLSNCIHLFLSLGIIQSSPRLAFW